MITENDTLSKIKLAALTLFNEKGYSATTTREIANEVGIKSSTLYFYFKSKEDIFFTLYREARELFDKNKHARFNKIEDGNIEKQLYALFMVSMELFIEHNLYSRFLYRYLIYPVYGVQDKIKVELEQWTNIATKHVYSLFCKGNEVGLFRNLSVDNLVRTYYRYQNGFTYELISSNRIPSKEELDEAWKIYWNGIRS
ncbi:transcriptional regulator, TetR family [Clostridiales bacterium oral taxon 876 str. F0540]|nr:transcriptional regulator, TetR family [Clostridiales bacterium oral taxon 876 str. F0540]